MAPGFDVLRLIGSFALVLALLGGLLWLLRRLQTRSGLLGAGKRQMQLLETLSLGTRQKIVLLRVGSRELVLGVTPTQITTLDSKPVAEPSAAATPSFAANLERAAQALAPFQEPRHGD